MSCPACDLSIPNWKDTCDATGCNYLNPAAFAHSAGRSGDQCDRPSRHVSRLATRAVRRNGICNATFAKNFAHGRRQEIAGASRLLQRVQQEELGEPVSAINASDFGRMTSARGNRSMQIGARLSF